MNLQDKTSTRTASDLEKKYDFAKMLGLSKNIEINSQQLIKVQNELNNMLKALVINLGDIVETQTTISLWFYEGIPTTENEPFINWESPEEHIGDFYYDKLTGYVYEYLENGWERKYDTNLINALALTNVELDTTEDHERKVFFAAPMPPYQAGDWWILEDGTLMICQITNIGQTYNENDFVLSDRYAEMVITRMNETLIIAKGNITTIIQGQNEIVQRIDNQDGTISSIEQTVDEINQKIQDVTDITVSDESILAEVSLLNVNTSQPIMIKIRPIGESISYLYPGLNTFPSSTTFLKQRTLRFHNTTNDEIFDWVLPTNLWYYDENNFDELTLSYDSNNVIVKRKCGVNSSGQIYALGTEETETYEYPEDLLLSDGNYTVSLLGYASAYLFVRLMASNIYTTQFATKVEMTSAIEQTAQTIGLAVSRKLDTSDFTSANIMLAINNDGTSSALINANKININGVITAINNNTTTNINGDKIRSGSIESNNYVANTSGTRINLTDGTIDTKDFKVSSTGQITATRGLIGGWDINNNYIGKLVGNRYSIELRTDRPSNEPALLVYDNQGGYNWYVRPDGYMYCRNGDFAGTINSSSGNIGGWYLSSSYLYNGGTGGNNGARLYNDGRLYMKNNYGWINTGSGGTLVSGMVVQTQ